MGTYRADRDALFNEDVPLGPMVAPLHLSDIARGYFATIADILEQQKRSSPHYAEHVGLLALRLEQIAMYQAVIETEGCTFTTQSVITTKDGSVSALKIMKRAHPAVAMLDAAMRHAQSLLGELMLNPSAALKLATGHKQVEDDPYADF
ncbi:MULTISPECIES: P27 family phage terminase small subunit [unclassified Sphingobium]|uniref:P27 family phage terminase small subunit n=1 Tax=unclassified Sphingobium TaxID=2611147 RepID=UPI0035A739AD